MAFDHEHLKNQLLFEPDLSKLWNLFMDIACDPAFLEKGFPSQDEKLLTELGKLAKIVTDRVQGKVRFQGMSLFESVPGEMYHGPLFLSIGLGNFFYFRSVNAGLFTVPTGLPQPNPNCTYARFSVNWKLKGESGKVQ